MSTESKPQTAPEPFDIEMETRKQTDLLNSINGKLGFMVFVLVITIIFQIFGALMSF